MSQKPSPFDQFTEARSSAFEPRGPASKLIADLGWVMTGVFTLVFIWVLIMLAIGVFRKKKAGNPEAPGGDNRFIVWTGLVIPTLILLPLLVYTLIVSLELKPKPSELHIKLTGYMWWWDVEYKDSGVRIANEIYIPVGRPVKLEMTSADVIHSFWPPNLSGKTDLIPGQTTYHWLEASEAGTYRAQCAEFCGLQHARMALFVIAIPEEEFAAWVEDRVRPREPLTDPVLIAGEQAFQDEGCASCHRVRDTLAAGMVGPDLSHMGSRLSIGAGVLPNTYGNLAGWVANPQALKPGNHMPPSYIDSANFHPLVTYLMSLK